MKKNLVIRLIGATMGSIGFFLVAFEIYIMGIGCIGLGASIILWNLDKK